VAIDLINNILPSIEHFRIGGYWIAFFAALLETTIGIGLVLPGSTIILILGALSARGYLDVGDLIWFSVLGAVIGDNINYYLGGKYGAKWLKDGFWFLKAGHLEKAKYFMDIHGAKGIFIGRFLPSVKEVAPFIAGSLKMNKRTFMFWNVLGAIGWGFEWVLAGYIFAQSLNLAELWLSRIGLLLAFLVIFGGILYLFKRLMIREGKRFLTIFTSLGQSIKDSAIRNDHVLLWMQKHPRSISFLKARFDTTAFSGLTLSIFTLAFVYVLALFSGVLEDLITSDPIITADIRLANLFFVFRTDALTSIFTWITVLGKGQVILAFIFISGAVLWLWQKRYCILPLLIAVTGSEAFTYLGKLVFHRPRPEMAVYAEPSFSFPSGHATIFTTILIIIAIGVSRVYLGVHYVSDVWSGYLVGALWLIIATSFAEWLGHKERGDQSISVVGGVRPISFALVFIAILFYVGSSMNYHPPLASVPSKSALVVAKGTDIFTSEQMKYTETLTGDRQEPVNYIFVAKNDRHLVAALQEAGWILTDKEDISAWIKAVKALIFKTPYPSAPISPSFWNAKIQDIGFAKVPGPNWLRDAHHVKIWQTNFILENGNRIYVGMVHANDGFKWGIIPKITADLDTEQERLYLGLNRAGKIESHMKAQLVKPLTGTTVTGDPFFSSGMVYIISVQ
jgi:membrane protein DedA with SNARE-associated domain/membrane-associated phospholipid phosphatase